LSHFPLLVHCLIFVGVENGFTLFLVCQSRLNIDEIIKSFKLVAV